MRMKRRHCFSNVDYRASYNIIVPPPRPIDTRNAGFLFQPTKVHVSFEKIDKNRMHGVGVYRSYAFCLTEVFPDVRLETPRVFLIGSVCLR